MIASKNIFYFILHISNKISIFPDGMRVYSPILTSQMGDKMAIGYSRYLMACFCTVCCQRTLLSIYVCNGFRDCNPDPRCILFLYICIFQKLLRICNLKHNHFFPASLCPFHYNSLQSSSNLYRKYKHTIIGNLSPFNSVTLA